MKQKKKKEKSENKNNEALGDFVCLFCKEKGSSKSLCAAGTYHATTSKNSLNHVKTFTDKLKTMALVLGNNHVLAKLSSGDIASNELYYHSNCYKRLLYDYQQSRTKETDSR